MSPPGPAKKPWYAQYWVYAHDVLALVKQLPTLKGVNREYCVLVFCGRLFAVTTFWISARICVSLMHTGVALSVQPLAGSELLSINDPPYVSAYGTKRFAPPGPLRS